MELNDAIYEFIKNSLAQNNELENNQSQNNTENNIQDNKLHIKNLGDFQGIIPTVSPLLLKICTGSATEAEIIQWANENNMTVEDAHDIIPTLKEYCENGYNMAESLDSTKIVKNITNNDKDTIDKVELKRMIDRIEYLENTIEDLTDRIKTLENFNK